MRVYYLRDDCLPQVTHLDEIIRQMRTAHASAEAISQLVYDIEHTGFSSGIVGGARIVVLKASLIDATKTKPTLAIIEGGLPA